MLDRISSNWIVFPNEWFSILSSSLGNGYADELVWRSSWISYLLSILSGGHIFGLLFSWNQRPPDDDPIIKNQEFIISEILLTSIFIFLFFGEIRNLTTLCLLNNNGFSLSSFFSLSLLETFSVNIGSLVTYFIFFNLFLSIFCWAQRIRSEFLCHFL